MSNVTVHKANDNEKDTLPVFTELGKRIEEVRRRAFEMFERRDRTPGNEIDDWLNAEHEVLGWSKAQLKDNKEALEIQLTLPGFEAKDVEVTASPGQIVVHAAAESGKKSEEGRVLWTEFGSNELYRLFELPAATDLDKVTAKLDKGILRINAPKTAPPKKSIAAA